LARLDLSLRDGLGMEKRLAGHLKGTIMHGWMAILVVDLHELPQYPHKTQQYADKYLGGRGIASRLYWEKVTPGTKASTPATV